MLTLPQHAETFNEKVDTATARVMDALDDAMLEVWGPHHLSRGLDFHTRKLLRELIKKSLTDGPPGSITEEIHRCMMDVQYFVRNYIRTYQPVMINKRTKPTQRT